MNKIIYIAWVFAISVIMGIIFTYIDLWLWWKFLYNFLLNQILTIIITLISFNIASVTFMISNLLNIEETHWKELFSGTRKELSDNIHLMIGVFILIFLLLLWLWDSKQVSGLSFFSYKSVLLWLFFIEIFAVVEIFNLIMSYKWNRSKK